MYIYICNQRSLTVLYFVHKLNFIISEVTYMLPGFLAEANRNKGEKKENNRIYVQNAAQSIFFFFFTFVSVCLCQEAF